MSNQGEVVQLFRKVQHGAAMQQETELSLQQGLGICGDRHSHAISPRQVLVVRHEDLSSQAIADGALRENIVVQNIPAEHLIPGSLLEFEGGANIRLTFYCEPCKKLATVVKDWQNFKGKRGVLGVVIQSGTVAIADQFRVIPNAFPALAEIPYERFLYFITKIPRGKVITYREVILGMGVDRSYFRAIPQYLRKTSPLDYPIHRILNSQGALIPHIQAQQEKLEVEGVEIIKSAKSRQINLDQYLWQDATIYLP